MQLIIYRNVILLLGLVISFCQCLQNPCLIGAQDAKAYFADFDGDNSTDVFCLDDLGNVYVLLSTTYGLQSPNSKSSGFLLDDFWCPAPKVFKVIDLNGDGKADVTCTEESYSGPRLSNGTSLYVPSGFRYYIGYCMGGLLYWKDFNGDGILDLFCWNKLKQKISVQLSDSSLAFQSPNSDEWGQVLTKWCTNSDQDLYFGDFNNDKKVDLLCQTPTGSYLMVSDGSKFVSPNKDLNGYMGQFCSFQLDNVYFRDYNGDGKADLICQKKKDERLYGKWKEFFSVALSTGTSFMSSTSLSK